MLTTAKSMPESMYSIENNEPCFTDEIVYTSPDGTSHKLYLDRRLFTANPKDSMWVRYASVDLSMLEE